MNDFNLCGQLVNDHDYTRMSQAIIRLIHTGPSRPPTGEEEVA
jgi:ribose transport system ATP-binding protein